MQLSSGMRLRTSWAIVGIMVLTFVLLMLRSSGVYTSVLGDEYTYNSMSRLMPLSAASIPGYLYLSIYKLTLVCGDGFMGCVKIFNSMFFVAAAPFIYMTARRFCGNRVSILIVALSMLGPINSYTSFFMPEALFFLFFWIGICYFLSLDARSPVKSWMVFGVIMGCSSLIKPHALFIVPALCLCIVFFAYKDVEDWIAIGLKNSFLFVVSMLSTKFFVSFLIAGKSGLTLFGNFYTSTLESNTSSLQRYVDIVLAAPKIAEGHLLANALMFGCALAVIIFGTLKAFSNRSVTAEEKIAFCTLALLLNLIAVVALFTASVAGSNAVETAFRLHMRYYDFILPLLFIAVGSKIDSSNNMGFKYGKLTLVVIIIAGVFYAALNHMQPFTTSYIDNPELRGYTFSSQWLLVLAVTSTITLLLWCKSSSIGAKAFLFLYLPLSVSVSTVYNTLELRQRMQPDAYDRAGMFVKSYLPSSELSSLVVVGDNPALVMRSLFYVDNIHAVPDITYVPGVPYTASQTPPDKKWVLVFGDVELVKDDFKVMRFNGYSLARKISSLYPLVLDFSNSITYDSVAKISGLSHVENWGSWSDGVHVAFAFNNPLPPKFEMVITANAYGPNINQLFEIKIGSKVYPIKLSAEMTSQTVSIDNPDNLEKLTINVPHPISPKELGSSDDPRLLGIGLRAVTIRPLP